MTPNDVKELLKTLITKQNLPVNVVDILPNQKTEGNDYTTETRIKDVVHQWNKDGKIHSQPPGEGSIMKYYTKTDATSAANEFLDFFRVEALLESFITEKQLTICYSDHGFRLVTLNEEDTTRYPVKILHGGFRFEKHPEKQIEQSQLEGIATRFETKLKEQSIKAKMFHRGFILKHETEPTLPLSQVKEITKLIDETLNINYVMDSYTYTPAAGSKLDPLKETDCSSANIRISLWRYKHRHW